MSYKDAEDFLETGPESGRGGIPCQTCTAADEWCKEQILRFAEARRDRDARAISKSWSAFLEKVLRPHGYAYSQAALRKHVTQCIGFGWHAGG